MNSPHTEQCSISNFLYYLTQPTVCTMYKRTLTPPTKKIILNTADRSSGVVFLSVSGLLGKSGTLVKTKGAAVHSQMIHILWTLHYYCTTNIEILPRPSPKTKLKEKC